MVEPARPGRSARIPTTITNAHQLQLMAMIRRELYAGGHIDLGSSLRPSANILACGRRRASTRSAPSTKFTGSFDGQGGTISGLLINRPTTNYVGLFGYVGIGGTVHHVGLQNVTVTGQNDTGALAGYNVGTITQAYAAGTVSGAGLVGGLVGVNSGTITQAYAPRRAYRQLCRRLAGKQQCHHAVLRGRDGGSGLSYVGIGRRQLRHHHLILLGRNDVGTGGRRRH
jgi:hypothetical protein